MSAPPSGTPPVPPNPNNPSKPAAPTPEPCDDEVTTEVLPTEEEEEENREQ